MDSKPVTVLLIALLSAAATAKPAVVDGPDVRRVTEPERARVGNGHIVFANGLAPALTHAPIRSRMDPKAHGIAEYIVGAAGGAAATSGPPGVIGTLLAAPVIIEMNDQELWRLHRENADAFLTLRERTGGFDCRLPLARAMDARLKTQTWLRMDRVLVTPDYAHEIIAVYEMEPVDALLLVEATCSMSVDLMDARIEARVELYSKSLGPEVYAHEGADGSLEPARWSAAPVYRNHFLFIAPASTEHCSAERVATKRAQVVAEQDARLAKARTPQHENELSKERDLALRRVDLAGRLSLDEARLCAREYWMSGPDAKLETAFSELARSLATRLVEDIGVPPRKKRAAKRPIILEGAGR